MNFINECRSYFIQNDLEETIRKKASENNHKAKESYRIVLRNGYPTICIGHDRYYVHRLLGELYFGNCELIHHKDHNKLNNLKSNLEPMTNSQHAIHHHKGNDFRSEEGMMRSVMAMANKRKRNDIDSEQVKEARNSGKTYKELCEMFNCGHSVIAKILKQ
ncbi:MAG: HNH endonuclease [Bacilli bacterium]|nr:HNH endonuclease [Bacilli bacterium]